MTIWLLRFGIGRPGLEPASMAHPRPAPVNQLTTRQAQHIHFKIISERWPKPGLFAGGNGN